VGIGVGFGIGVVVGNVGCAEVWLEAGLVGEAGIACLAKTKYTPTPARAITTPIRVMYVNLF
jgi:hypothetical protein